MTVQQPERPTDSRRLQGALLGLIVVLAAVRGVPSVAALVRDGDADLAAVFYPVLLVAAVALAWGRRSGA